MEIKTIHLSRHMNNYKSCRGQAKRPLGRPGAGGRSLVRRTFYVWDVATTYWQSIG